MDELKWSNNNQYAYLRRLPIGKLMELLEAAPVPASCAEDEAYVDALEEAIIEKESEAPTGLFPDVDRQWEQFAAQYLPDLEDSVLESEHISPRISARANRRPSPTRAVRFSRARRTVLAAAAAIACMFAVMVSVQAAGVDVFGAMARWTEGAFSFGQIVPDSQVSDDIPKETAGQKTETPVGGSSSSQEPVGTYGMNGMNGMSEAPDTEFASLQEAFDAYGMTEVHEPSWLPEGYTLEELNIICLDDPFLRSFEAYYTNGEGFISVGIMSYEGQPATQVQKTDDDDSVELIEKDGRTFYLIKNTKNYTLAWCTDQYEYYLTSKEGEILWKVAESMLS